MAELFLTDYTPLRAGKHVVYHGESGRSAYYRWRLHEAVAEDGDLVNAFAKHTAIFHVDKAGDPSIYKMSYVKTFPKSLERGPGDHGQRGRTEGGLPDELARGVQAPGVTEGDIDQTRAGTGKWELNYSDNKG